MWFQLKPQEAEFLAVNTNAALSTFEKVSENIGKCMYYLISIQLCIETTGNRPLLLWRRNMRIATCSL